MADSLATSVLRRDLSNLEGLEIRTLALEALGNLKLAAIASSQAGVVSGDGAHFKRAAELHLKIGALDSAAWSLGEAARLYQEAGLLHSARLSKPGQEGRIS